MVEITYQMVLSTLQTIALIVGIAYYLIIMRNSQRNQQMQLETRQAQLFMNLFSEWRSKEMSETVNELVFSWVWSDHEDFKAKYGSETNLGQWNKFTSVVVFFEGIGLLVHKGLVDPYYVRNLMGGRMWWFWEKYEQVFMNYRKEWNMPEFVEWYEHLYKISRTT